MNNSTNDIIRKSLSKILQGDEDSIGVILNCIKADMVKAIETYVLIRNDCEDIISEVLDIIVIKAKDLVRMRKPFSWIMTVVKNKAIDKVRDVKRKKEVALSEAESQIQEIEIQDNDTVERVLSEIPPPDRQILIGKLWDKLTFKKLSKKFKMPISTIEYRLERAREKAREVYKRIQ